MTTGPLILSEAMLLALLSGTPERLDQAALTALLLTPDYLPDPVSHGVYADIAAYEVAATDYQRQRLHGGRFAATATGASFTSDPILFGDPVCLPPVRYLAFCFGLPAALEDDAPLVGVMDLAPGGVAVEAVRGRFAVTPPAEGWLTLAQAN